MWRGARRLTRWRSGQAPPRGRDRTPGPGVVCSFGLFGFGVWVVLEWDRLGGGGFVAVGGRGCMISSRDPCSRSSRRPPDVAASAALEATCASSKKLRMPPPQQAS